MASTSCSRFNALASASERPLINSERQEPAAIEAASEPVEPWMEGDLDDQFHDVAADRMFQTRLCIGLFQVADVTRVLKVIENFFGVAHLIIENDAGKLSATANCLVTA